MLEVTVKVWGITQSVLKKKKRCSGKDLQKKKVTGMKERVGLQDIMNIISLTVLTTTTRVNVAH